METAKFKATSQGTLLEIIKNKKKLIYDITFLKIIENKKFRYMESINLDLNLGDCRGVCMECDYLCVRGTGGDSQI